MDIIRSATASGAAAGTVAAAAVIASQIRILGKHGNCLLIAEGCSEARVDDLSMSDGTTLHRLQFIRWEVSGSLTVRAEWT